MVISRPPSSIYDDSSHSHSSDYSESIYTDELHSELSDYSEVFPLEEVLKQISEQTLEQEERTRDALLEELKMLKQQLDLIQSAWQTFCEAVELGRQISLLFGHGQRRMELAKRRWLANCTAF